MGYRHRWLCDDAFIDFRVVEFLREGFGPRFNIIERVEAFTSPMWVAWLWAGTALGGHVEGCAVVGGLVATTLGVVLMQAASVRLLRTGDSDARRTVFVPIGALCLAVLPASWDFATSGLETGLALAWIGGAACVMAATAMLPVSALATRGARPLVASIAGAVIIGVGPLVRPDLGIVALVLGIATLWCLRNLGASWKRVALLGASACCLPLAYEAFRMGYFACLVPNSALAKEAGSAYWSQGLRYLADFGDTYALWIPLAGLAWPVVDRLLHTSQTRERVPRLALLVAGALHATYVVRVGGDFMHARLLLPSWACICAGLGLLPVLPGKATRLKPVYRLGVAGALAWLVWVALFARVPFAGILGPGEIVDERAYYIRQAGVPHPVTLADYREISFGQNGRAFRMFADRPAFLATLAQRGAAAPGDTSRWALVDRRDEPPAASLPPADARIYPLRLDLDPRIHLVCSHPNIGITGVIAGPSVHLVDRLGLSDPIGSRLQVKRRGRPGHEKMQPNAWILARFSTAMPSDSLGPQVSAARRVLAAQPSRGLLEAVSAPLTARRFLLNLQQAVAFTHLRLAVDPVMAERNQRHSGNRP